MTFAFPAETQSFLRDLRAHNDKAWFDANRDRYQAAYVDAAVALVEALAPAVERLVPGIKAEPRLLGSIFRINRDVRFSADKRPYKDHLDLSFWHGDRKTSVSALFLRIAPDEVIVGAGAHGFDKPQRARYREAVIDERSGSALVTISKRLERAGYGVGGETYARTPKTPPVGPARERFLRHSALYGDRHEPAALATDASLLPTLLRHWKALAPLHSWLVDALG